MNIVVLAGVLAILAATYNSSGYVPIAPFFLSHSEFGCLLTAQGLGAFVALVPAGRAVDRLGSIPVLKMGIVILATSGVLSAMSVNVVVQLIGRICNGVGGSVAFNAAMAMIMERFQEPDRGTHIGSTIGLGTLGNLLGPPLAGNTVVFCRLHKFVQPQAMPFLLPLPLLFAAYIALLQVPDIGGASEIARDLITETEIKHVTWYEQFFGVYVTVGLRAWVLAAVLISLFGASNALLPAGILEMHSQGYSVVALGLAPIPAGLAQVVISRLGGRLSGTHGERVLVMIASPLVLAVVLSVLAMSSLFISGHLASKVIVGVLSSTAAMAIIDAPTISAMAELAQLHGRGFGEAVTATELAVTAGQAFGPSFGVAVTHVAGFDGLCFVLAAMSLAVSVACALILR